MKILIADENAISRHSLQSALVHLGHDVVAVEDGATALTALIEPNGPRLAILDMTPGLDGLAVCQTIRQRPGPYIYVVLQTSCDRPADTVEGLDAGADDVLTKPFDVAELRARLRPGERIIALQNDLLRTQEALHHQATHDRLTGLWNRGRVLDELAREASRSHREKASFAVVLADIDHFKRINDAHGHAAGDAVLQHVGQLMGSLLRTSDAIGRYGGEEFLFVLPRADYAGGREVAERVRAAVENAVVSYASGELRVTVSLGISSSAAGTFDPATLVQAAERRTLPSQSPRPQPRRSRVAPGGPRVDDLVAVRRARVIRLVLDTRAGIST